MKLLFLLLISFSIAEESQLTLRSKVRNETFQAYAKLRPERISKVASQTSGLLVSRHILSGQKVEKGQTLFAIDHGTLPEELKQIELELKKQTLQMENHSRRYQRRKKNPDAYTDENLELEKLLLDQLKLELDKLKSKFSAQSLMLGYKTVQAPFNGIVIDSLAEIGEWVMPGSPLLVLQSTDKWFAEVDVPWEIYSQIMVGDVVSISKNNKNYGAEISGKIPVYNSQTGQYRLEAILREISLQPTNSEILPMHFSILSKRLEIPLNFVKNELGTYQVQVFKPDGLRWISVEGMIQGEVFVASNMDLEGSIIQNLVSSQ